MLSPADLLHFRARTDAVSIHFKGDSLSGENLTYFKSAEFKNLKFVPEDIIKSKHYMSDLIGQDVLLQYPDSSSWSTTYHIEYVEINELVENPEIDDFSYYIVFRKLIESPPFLDEKYLYYHEPSSQFLKSERRLFQEPSFKIWVSSNIHDNLLNKLSE